MAAGSFPASPSPLPKPSLDSGAHLTFGFSESSQGHHCCELKTGRGGLEEIQTPPSPVSLRGPVPPSHTLSSTFRGTLSVMGERMKPGTTVLQRIPYLQSNGVGWGGGAGQGGLSVIMLCPQSSSGGGGFPFPLPPLQRTAAFAKSMQANKKREKASSSPKSRPHKEMAQLPPPPRPLKRSSSSQRLTAS